MASSSSSLYTRSPSRSRPVVWWWCAGRLRWGQRRVGRRLVFVVVDGFRKTVGWWSTVGREWFWGFGISVGWVVWLEWEGGDEAERERSEMTMLVLRDFWVEGRGFRVWGSGKWGRRRQMRIEGRGYMGTGSAEPVKENRPVRFSWTGLVLWPVFHRFLARFFNLWQFFYFSHFFCHLNPFSAFIQNLQNKIKSIKNLKYIIKTSLKLV